MSWLKNWHFSTNNCKGFIVSSNETKVSEWKWYFCIKSFKLINQSKTERKSKLQNELIVNSWISHYCRIIQLLDIKLGFLNEKIITEWNCYINKQELIFATHRQAYWTHARLREGTKVAEFLRELITHYTSHKVYFFCTCAKYLSTS